MLTVYILKTGSVCMYVLYVCMFLCMYMYVFTLTVHALMEGKGDLSSTSCIIKCYAVCTYVCMYVCRLEVIR